ncbi:MAG: SCO family protein, partial [Gaiellales bacterium]
MKWVLAVGVLTLLLLGSLATAFGLTGGQGESVPGLLAAKKYRGSEPPDGLRLPSFTLREYTGAVVRSDRLHGKVVLVTFLDSQCNQACPIIAAQIGRTIDGLAAKDRESLEVIAISTDPLEDTAASVRRFLARQRAVGKVRYLTRPAPAIRSVWKSFKILSSLESGTDTVHSAPVRIYDRDGFWVPTLHAGVDLTPTNLAHDIT